MKDSLYSDIAKRVAAESKDELVKVGCVIVKDNNILSMGYNGTPSGHGNTTRDPEGKTLPTVVHSEANALMKLARTGGGSEGATIYCTHSPCWECSKLILQAGISRVVYSQIYDADSVIWLRDSGVKLEWIG